MCAKKERHKPLDLMLWWLEIQACSSFFNIILSASPTAFPAITSIRVFFLSFLIKRLLLEYSWKLSISRRWWRASCHFLTASQTVKNEVAHSHPCCPHAANSIPKSNKKDAYLHPLWVPTQQLKNFLLREQSFEIINHLNTPADISLSICKVVQATCA